MIIPAPRISINFRTHREMVLTRRYLYEDIDKFAEMVEVSVSTIKHFEKFNTPVSRNFFCEYSNALETVFDNNYFKTFRKARMKKGLTQQKVADKLHTTSSTISKFERGLITPSNLFIVSYGLLLGIKVYADDHQQLHFTECKPTDENLPIEEYMKVIGSENNQ